MREVLEVHRPLVGCGTEPEDRFRAFPKDHAIKGMYFSRLVARLSAAELEAANLWALPRDARYLPFKSYPQHDYSRISYLAAIKRHPRLSTREAMRRIARQDFEQLAASRVGKITLAFVGSCEEALMRLPDLYRLSVTGPTFVSERRSEAVRLTFADYHGWLDSYTLGTLEGIVQHYGHSPRLSVDLPSDFEGTVDISWR